MVKFKWPPDKILLQRALILSIIGLISCGIVKGHVKYEQEVANYMNSLEYRKLKEASEDYSVEKMKRNRQMGPQPNDEPSVENMKNKKD